MNKGQFKDPMCYLCQVGCDVASMSLLVKEVAGSSNLFLQNKILCVILHE